MPRARRTRKTTTVVKKDSFPQQADPEAEGDPLVIEDSQKDARDEETHAAETISSSVVPSSHRSPTQSQSTTTSTSTVPQTPSRRNDLARESDSILETPIRNMLRYANGEGEDDEHEVDENRPPSANISTVSGSGLIRRSRRPSVAGNESRPIRPTSRGLRTPLGATRNRLNLGQFQRRKREPSILGATRRPLGDAGQDTDQEDNDLGLGVDSDSEDDRANEVELPNKDRLITKDSNLTAEVDPFAPEDDTPQQRRGRSRQSILANASPRPSTATPTSSVRTRKRKSLEVDEVQQPSPHKVQRRRTRTFVAQPDPIEDSELESTQEKAHSVQSGAEDGEEEDSDDDDDEEELNEHEREQQILQKQQLEQTVEDATALISSDDESSLLSPLSARLGPSTPPHYISRTPSQSGEEVDPAILAPPISDSDEDENGHHESIVLPTYEHLAKRKKRRLSITTTPLHARGQECESELSSPPSLTHSPLHRPSRSVDAIAAAKKREEPIMTSADLAQLLPRRRTKDVNSDDEEESRESEETRRSKASRNRKKTVTLRGGAASATNDEPRNHSSSSRTGKRVQSKRVAQTYVSKKRSSTNPEPSDNDSPSDQDDDGREESQWEPLPDDTFHDESTTTVTATTAATPRKPSSSELRRAAQKFREVDQWEMAFEEASSSQADTDLDIAPTAAAGSAARVDGDVMEEV